MFWEMYQQWSIHKVEQKAGRADLKADQTQEHIRLLEMRVESLALACQSLWELLRDNQGITEAQLNAKMEEVDLRDGKKDGRMTSTVRTCPSCGRNLNRRRKLCLYCGLENAEDEPFGMR